MRHRASPINDENGFSNKRGQSPIKSYLQGTTKAWERYRYAYPGEW